MMNSEVIWTSVKRIAAVFNNLGNDIRREVGYRIIKWTLLMELPADISGGRLAGMGDSGGELFSKSCCYFMLRVRDLGKR